MLIRSSGLITEDLALLTLGRSCRYVVIASGSCCLFDPGATLQVPHLMQRLAALNLEPRHIHQILLTHLHADRAGAAVYLKRLNPYIKLVGSRTMQGLLTSDEFLGKLFAEDQALSALYPVLSNVPTVTLEEYREHLRLDVVVKDADIVPLVGSLQARVFEFPGHTQESLAYFVEPHHFLIADEGAGYYRGRDLAAPGGDYSLEESITSIRRLGDVDVQGLCLPYQGILTGQLISRYLADLVVNSNDLREQSLKAFQEGIPLEHIRNSIQEGFFISADGDKLLNFCLQRTNAAVWQQLETFVESPTTIETPEKDESGTGS